MSIAGISAVRPSSEAHAATLPKAATPTELSIPTIQGHGSSSPYVDKLVTTTGVVTALAPGGKAPGFYLQDLAGDKDAATSDAIFVSTQKLAKDDLAGAVVGKSLSVTGTIAEPDAITTLQLDAASGVRGLKNAKLAKDEDIVPTELHLPASRAQSIGYLEARESMIATLPNAMAIGPSDKYGEFTAVDVQAHGPRRDQGDERAGQRILVAGKIGPRTQFTTGDRMGNVRGPVGTVFGDYAIFQTDFYKDIQRAGYPQKMWGDMDADGKIGDRDLAAIKARIGQPASGPTDGADLNADGKITRVDVDQAAQRAARITGKPTFHIAAMNAQNFFDSVDNPNMDDDVPSANEHAAKLARMSGVIREQLNAPDVLAMVEVENTAVLDELVNRPELKALGYRYALLPTSGHRSINPAFLYRGDSVDVSNVRQVQKMVKGDKAPSSVVSDPTTGDAPAEGPLFAREPLIADVTIHNGDEHQDMTLVVNHLISKFSPHGLPTDPIRIQQAKFLNAMVKDMEAKDPSRPVMLLGDLNDGADSKAMKALTGPAKDPALVNLTSALIPKGERYSFNMDGNTDLIDHIMVSPSLAGQAEFAGVTHVNSDMPSGMTWESAPYAASDHDSPYALFHFPQATPPAGGNGAAADATAGAAAS